MQLFLLGLFLFLSGCANVNRAPVVAEHYQQPRWGYYRVKPDDTLYSIAFAYDIDFKTLARINGLSSPYKLQVGQLIRIRHPQPHKISVYHHPIIHLHKLYIKHKNYLHSKITVGKWLWPNLGKVITYYNPKAGNKGINIANRLGSPIVAAASGIIVYAGSGLHPYGLLIIIKHNERYLSAYAHNEKMLVHEGQRVRKGQKIALMGHSGSTKTMLHFEIRRLGQPVNPLRYLP